MFSFASGPSVLIAKLATRSAKPNGQCHVDKGEIADFIRGVDIGDLPG